MQFKTQPYKHQLDVFKRARDTKYYALFLEQGTGKTKITIDVLSYKYMKGEINCVIVLAPKGVYANWHYNELVEHSPVKYKSALWTGDTSVIISFKHLDDELPYYIFNIDAIISVKWVNIWKALRAKYTRIAIVIDESTIIKNMKASRTKAALGMTKDSVFRVILSGTPLVQSPMDLYSQCEFLYPGVLGHKSIYTFRNYYAIQKLVRLGTRAFNQIIGYRGLEELTQKVAEFGSVIKKEDCLDLPPKIYKTVAVDLTETQRRHYQDLTNQALTYIGGNEITAVNALALITRLLQIVCGQIKIGPDRYEAIHNNRLDALEELVDEAQGKVIVWTHFVLTAKMIHEQLGKSSIILPGSQAPEARQEILTTFKTQPEKKVLIANPASSGHGITLTEADTVIYYSNSYNLEHRLQSEDRTHRIGQTRPVLYIDLIAPGTVETAVVKALREKKNLADTVINSARFMELINGN